jgi:hypothetical protein
MVINYDEAMIFCMFSVQVSCEPERGERRARKSHLSMLSHPYKRPGHKRMLKFT